MILAKKIFGFEIESGVSFERVLKMNLILPKDVRFLLALFQRRKYLPIMDLQQKKIYIILSKDVDDGDILKAYFHSAVYALITSRMIGLCPVSIEKLHVKQYSIP